GYSPERTLAVFDRIEEELAALPGVTSVGSAGIPLLTGSATNNDVAIQGVETAPGTNITASRNEVSSGFFNTLSIPLIAGRTFTDADAPNMPKVAIVNEAFVRRFNLGNSAIGKRFSGFPFDNVRKIELEIVGVVADAAYSVV